MKRPILYVWAIVILYAAIWNVTELPQKEAYIVRSESALEEAADSDRMLVIEGRVQKSCRTSSGIRLYLNELSVQQSGEKRQLPKEHSIFFTAEEANAPTAGDWICVRGEWKEFESAGNPGQFDAYSYYHLSDTVGMLRKAEILQWEPSKGGIRTWMEKVRNVLDDSCIQILGKESGQTFAAIALGEKSWMDSETKTQYQENGIAHIASVSGLHISLLGMGMYRLFRRMVPWISCAGISSCIGMTLFVILSGGAVSAIRALIMFAIWLGAQLLGRKYDSKTALAAAGIWMLLEEPRNLQSASFLLSFAAVGCISFLIPEAEACIRLPRKLPLLSSVQSGFFLWYGMLPVTLWFFYQTPLGGMLLNLAVIPLMPAVMGFGLAAVSIGMICQPLGIFIGAPVSYLLTLFGILCEQVQKLPEVLQIWGKPSAAAVLLYYALAVAAVFCSRKWKKQAGLLIWCVCIVFSIHLMKPRQPEEMEILCMDVGQGDGTLLRMPDGMVCLIDGGSSSEKKVWENRISQVLCYYGEDEIDYILLSHADADHINGIEQFLTEYEENAAGKNMHGITVHAIVLPPTADAEDFQKLCELGRAHRVPIYRMNAGDTIGGSGKEAQKNWKLQALAPKESELSGDKNEDSMVLLFQYGAFRMLFTGDLEGSAEDALAEKAQNLKADVLKVGHHGSKNGTSEAFLEKVKPSSAVISCAAENRYGHPAEETVERLEQSGTRIYCTAQSGAVQIQTDGVCYQVRPYKSEAE